MSRYHGYPSTHVYVPIEYLDPKYLAVSVSRYTQLRVQCILLGRIFRHTKGKRYAHYNCEDKATIFHFLGFKTIQGVFYYAQKVYDDIIITP